MTNRVMKSNPAFLSDDALKENFVVRHADLDLIVGVIRENTTGSNQHILVIGPRGSGKTTLVLRTALEVRADKELSERWYPLVFSEESYQVVSAGEFWLEALFHLSEQTADERWWRAWSELKEETDDNRLGERALYQLLDFADSRGKRILLIVENLNMLISDLASPDEAWKIRHTLMNEPRLMLLASATSRFEHFENSSQAMFEMFKMHPLIPLDDGECNAIWELISGQKLEGEKIRPIRILTGGNPRLLAIIAKFGAGRSFGSLLDDLVYLIDDHTEYFKSHLDNLPATERKAYLALAELWDPSTAREVAKAARLDVNTASSLLNRLSGRGAVTVEKKGKRTKYYAVAERMYNIYYLMRRRGRPADRVKAAVKFMVGMYGPESATRLIAEEACKLAPELCLDHYVAYAEVVKGVRDPGLLEKIILSTPKTFLESPHIDRSVRDLIATYANAQRPSDAAGDDTMRVLEKAFTLLKDGKYQSALKMFDNFIAKFGELKGRGSVGMVACALIGRGNALTGLGRYKEAIGAHDDAARLIGDSDDPLLTALMALNLVENGIALETLGRFDEALRAYDDALERSGGREGRHFTGPRAMALTNTGRVLESLGRTNEAIKIYDEIVQLFGNSADPYLAESAAKALCRKGIAIGTLGRPEDEIKAYDEIVERYGRSKEPGLAEQVAIALLVKGITLGALGRPEDTIRASEDAVERFGDSKDPVLAKHVASALVVEGFALGDLGRYGQAEESLLKAIQLDPEPTAAHLGLIRLLLQRPESQANALRLAEEILRRKPDDAALLNGLSWMFYKQNSPALLEKGEMWARRAVSVSPGDLSCHHTLACILAALGKGKEALESAEKSISDAEFVETKIEHTITLFVDLASSGYAKESLELIENSPAAKHLEPLIVGLKLYNGEDVRTAAEILEVARDVVRRIEDRREGKSIQPRLQRLTRGVIS